MLLRDSGRKDQGGELGNVGKRVSSPHLPPDRHGDFSFVQTLTSLPSPRISSVPGTFEDKGIVLGLEELMEEEISNPVTAL